MSPLKSMSRAGNQNLFVGQKIQEMEVQENPTVIPTCQKKKKRKRMKAVYAKIREQMEFYFSDANLHKDRFLKKKMDETEEKYVDLTIFLNFNRIRSITTDLTVLAKALRKSELLEVNEEGTTVRRTTPVSEPANVDDRTVYVECLPSNADHDWIKRTFSSCGKVLYVSLPKYKSTRDPKGFAFVEFDTVESAQKACEVLNNPPVDAGDRPGRFPKTSKSLNRLEKQLLGVGDIGNTVEDSGLGSSYLHGENERPLEVEYDSKTSTTKSKKRDRKRHRNTSECSTDSTEGESSTKKKPKISEKSENGCDEREGKEAKIEEEGQETKSDTDRKQKRRKTDREGQEGVTSGEVETLNEHGKRIHKPEKQKSHESANGASDKMSKEPEPPSAKQRKRHEQDRKRQEEDRKRPDEDGKSKTDKKKRKRPRKKRNKEKEIPELRVIAKHKWLLLRNEYITTQKKNMTRLKQNLMSRKQKEQQSAEPGATEATPVGKAPKKDLEFVPDVIIHVKAEEPMQRKELREKLSTCGDIAYVDVKDGLMTGHIRCETADCAKNISETSVEGWSFVLLKGEDEKQYWDKLVADRETKFSKPKNKKRGTQKLIQRAERAQADVIQGKHVIFADE